VTSTTNTLVTMLGVRRNPTTIAGMRLTTQTLSKYFETTIKYTGG